ncbi:hypothetical protein LSH36_985g01026 [Paralvinella palmiformis]|uniref:peptidylprolyl isomerase n=1 Tax=Paralvinella palmiformis TaxID=53620 RepID=A0AAD9IWZ1_9ANNE|nr:hypothetical protein LSH36_985g01026 [Paralvinella palmiformis]
MSSPVQTYVDKPVVPDISNKNTVESEQESPELLNESEKEPFLNGRTETVNSDQEPHTNEPDGDSVFLTKLTVDSTDSLTKVFTMKDPQDKPAVNTTQDQIKPEELTDSSQNASVKKVEVPSQDVSTLDVDTKNAQNIMHAVDTRTDTVLDNVNLLDVKHEVTISETETVTSDEIMEDTKQHEGSDLNSSQNEAESGNAKSPQTSESEDGGWILVLGHEKLKKKKLKPGEGLSSRPEHGDIVIVSYSARLEDGAEVDKHEHQQFTMGDGDVIQALDLCTALMELHEVCMVITEAQYAYGAKGREPDIPPNARLTYTIELLTVDKSPDYSTWPLRKRIEEGNKKKERGNELYSRAEYGFAINSYTKALTILDDRNEMTHDAAVEELQLLLDTRMTCNNNLAAAQIKVEAWDAAIQSCDEVLKKQSENVKALFRKGKCLSYKGELEIAISYLQRASKLEPSSKVIQQELVRLQAKNRSQDKSQAAMYKRMFWGGKKAEKRAAEKSHWWLYAGGALSAAAISVTVAAYRYLHP